MEISAHDRVIRVPPNTDPDYNTDNPLHSLINYTERVQLAAEREVYAQEYLQYLVPFKSLELHGPRATNEDLLDARQQDFVDFQKQNIRGFQLGDFHFVRGWATIDDWTGPFLRLSYRGGPDSALSQAAGHQLSETICAYVKVGDVGVNEPLPLPYNLVSDRYELEIWGYPHADLRSKLDVKGKAAWDRGELIVRPDLIQGSVDDFRRENVTDRPIPQVAPTHAMHPTNPLRLETAWGDHTQTHWDSLDSSNYVHEYSMIVRGWDNYLKVGKSSNPHGGLGGLEYRNLLSNYFEFSDRGELGRIPAAWSFDAFHSKGHQARKEPFLAVDYMDLHIIEPNGGIGIHRHRDNQEIFMVLENEVVMIVGDWNEFSHRGRAFELRTVRAGHFALLKPGQLHGLLNPTDEEIPLLMFGGYD